MEKNLIDFRTILENEFQQFAENLEKSFMDVEGSLIEHVFEFIQRKSGKQLRPLLVLLSAKLCGNVTKQTFHAAVAVEMMHTASLLHDDVVDESNERRGNRSVNAEFDNQTAVLAGDMLLIKAMKNILKCNKQAIKLFVETGEKIAGGELIQLEHSFDFLSENTYYDIISRKTAALFALCTQLGAITAGASKEMEEKMQQFGYYLGCCFQIKDDIFDYTLDAKIGKPTLNDIREGKVTLPLIMAVQHAKSAEIGPIFDKIRDDIKNEKTIQEVYNFVNNNRGIYFATERMNVIAAKGKKILNSLPKSDEREALNNILTYAMERTC